MQDRASLYDRAVLLTRRLAGYVVDVLCLAAGLAILQAGFYVLDLNWALQNPAGWSLHSWVLSTVSVPCVIYFTVAPMALGATIGQKALGLRMSPLAAHFNPLALAARSVLLLLPFEINHLGLFWGLDAAGAPTPLLWAYVGAAYALAAIYIASALVDRNGRALHDRIGGVRVDWVA